MPATRAYPEAVRPRSGWTRTHLRDPGSSGSVRASATSSAGTPTIRHQRSGVSPNPLRANPAYESVRNPDYQLRWGLVEYLIYDAYSAARTPHFANRLLDFVERYGGEIVHEEYGVLVAEGGDTYRAPVIRIYRVGPVGLDPTPIEETLEP